MAKEKSDKAAKKPRAAKGSKKDKDPNAPKKNQSAYMIFCAENRPIVKEENPEAGFGDMGKLLGAKWKELDASGKKPYEDKAAADKERYAKDMEGYVPPAGAAAADDDEE